VVSHKKADNKKLIYLKEAVFADTLKIESVKYDEDELIDLKVIKEYYSLL
jgi:hypothetical protein